MVPVRRARAALAPFLVVTGVLAALVAAALVVASGGQHYADLGLPDAGPFTEDGLAVLGVTTELGAALCVGALLLAAFLVPPRRGGGLAADGYAAVRVAGWAAVLWWVSALLQVPFTVADALGRPVYHLTWSAMFPLAFTLEQPVAWLITAGWVFLVALGCWFALTWGWSAGLFVAVLAGLLPQAVTGHSSAGGAHDLATDSLIYHLFGAAIWVGGLVALLAHARRGGSHLALATRRFSACALGCWLVMAVSGVVNALVRLPVHDLFRTGYGLMVAGKITALLVLGVVGYAQRRTSVRAVVETNSRRPLIRLAGVEVLIMFVTIGLSAALSRTAPPTDGVTSPSTVEVQIGYALPGPPTPARLLLDWRFDLVFGTLALALAALYPLAVRRAGEWPARRTVSWLAGCLLLLLATSSGVGRYAPAVLSVHVSAHLVLTAFAPVLLVLGHPVTLALRALPVHGPDDLTGPRDWLLSLVGSPIARFLAHPAVAFCLYAGSAFALYLTGLFDAALVQHWAHLAMNAWFLLVGCLFFWSVLGVDSPPRALSRPVRLGLAAAALPFPVLFGLALRGTTTVVGGGFYRSLALPWLTDLAADQRLAGVLAIVLGELPLLVVVAVLLVRSVRPGGGSPGSPPVPR